MNFIGMLVHALILAAAVALVLMLKGKICYKKLSLSLIITYLMTLVPSCFEATQSFSAEQSELLLGFPFDFYTIKYTAAETFAVHFNLLGFAANIAAVYLVLTFCAWLWTRLKGERQ